MKASDLRWFLQDCVYPAHDQITSDATTEYVETRASQAENLLPSYETSDQIVQACQQLFESEESRRQSIDQRLTTLVGLSSIAGTLIIGATWAQMTGTLRSENRVVVWVIAVGTLYLALQIGCTVISAVEGLSRRSYEGLEPADAVPLSGESNSSYQRRRARKYLSMLADHQLQNNAKITKMAVAHRAVKNFVVMVIVLSALGSYFAIVGPKPENRLVEQLRNDQRLMNLLRGPQGPPGPQGPKGDIVRSNPQPCEPSKQGHP